jgi:hypothetical protein
MTSAVEPSDLSEPSGLAPSVSINKLLLYCHCITLFRFQCDNPTLPQVILELLYQSQPQQLLGLSLHNLRFTNQVAISTSVDSPGDGTFISKIILYNF